LYFLRTLPTADKSKGRQKMSAVEPSEKYSVRLQSKSLRKAQVSISKPDTPTPKESQTTNKISERRKLFVAFFDVFVQVCQQLNPIRISSFLKSN